MRTRYIVLRIPLIFFPYLNIYTWLSYQWFFFFFFDWWSRIQDSFSQLLCCLFLVQKRSVEGGKQGTSTKKLKKDKAASATGKTGRSEANAVITAPRVKPELALPVMYFLESSVIFFICHYTKVIAMSRNHALMFLFIPFCTS